MAVGSGRIVLLTALWQLAAAPCALPATNSPAAAAPEVIDVYLIGGQSNASGRAAPKQFAPQYQRFYARFRGRDAVPEAERILGVGRSDAGPIRLGYAGFGMCDGGSGPEIAAGYALHERYRSDPALKGRRLCIIKHTKGGTSLTGDWRPDGTLGMNGDGLVYRLFQETVSGGLDRLRQAHPAARINIAGMMWHQGESDAGAKVDTATYQELLTRLIAEVREKYAGGKPFPFAIGLLARESRGASAAIVEAQRNVAGLVENARAISTDGFEFNADRLHFSARGQEKLGVAFAAALLEMGCAQGATPWVESAHKEPLQATVHMSFDRSLESGGRAVYAGPARFSGERRFGSAALLLDGSYVLEANDFECVSRKSGLPQTVAFWFKRLDRDAAAQLIGRKRQERAPTARAWYLELGGDERLTWHAFPDGDKRTAVFEKLPVDDTDWHHYALMACDDDGDGAVNNMVLYVDGRRAGDTGRRELKTGFAAEAIGGDAAFPAQRARGVLDEFWLFPCALKAGQVEALCRTNAIPRP